jgi:hypothetical protein
VANCVWWLASILGLEQGLLIPIDNLPTREACAIRNDSEIIEGHGGDLASGGQLQQVHPERVSRVPSTQGVSSTPRDLSEDQRAVVILDGAEQSLEESGRARNQWQLNRDNPLQLTKRQLKKARKTKRLQEARNTEVAKRNQTLRDIRTQVKQNLSKE